MGSAKVPEGLVKKEVMIIAALVALVIGFLGGVFFSSVMAPSQPASVAQGKAQQPAAGQPQAGPTAEQAAQIFGLEEAVRANPANGGAWTQLGNLYFDSDQPGRAIAAYNKSLELNQGQPDVWTDLGVMYRRSRQFKEALAAFDKAISLQPGFEQALFNKGVVLIHDLGDKSGGIQAWQQVVAINPNFTSPNGQSLKDLIVTASK